MSEIDKLVLHSNEEDLRIEAGLDSMTHDQLMSELATNNEAYTHVSVEVQSAADALESAQALQSTIMARRQAIQERLAFLEQA